MPHPSGVGCRDAIRHAGCEGQSTGRITLNQRGRGCILGISPLRAWEFVSRWRLPTPAPTLGLLRPPARTPSDHPITRYLGGAPVGMNTVLLFSWKRTATHANRFRTAPSISES